MPFRRSVGKPEWWAAKARKVIGGESGARPRIEKPGRTAVTGRSNCSLPWSRNFSSSSAVNSFDTEPTR